MQNETETSPETLAPVPVHVVTATERMVELWQLCNEGQLNVAAQKLEQLLSAQPQTKPRVGIPSALLELLHSSLNTLELAEQDGGGDGHVSRTLQAELVRVFGPHPLAPNDLQPEPEPELQAPELRKVQIGLVREGWLPWFDLSSHAESVADRVLVEQVIEQLEHPKALELLQSVCRVLAPGGRMRLTFTQVPKLLTFSADYLEQAKAAGRGTTDRECLEHLLLGDNRQSLWTPELVLALCKAAGFDGATVRAPDDDPTDPAWEGLELRGLSPEVTGIVEAWKLDRDLLLQQAFDHEAEQAPGDWHPLAEVAEATRGGDENAPE